MTVPLAPSASASDRGRVKRTRTTAFGLDVWSAQPASLLAGARARPTGRRLGLSMSAGGIEALDWPRQSQIIGEQLEPDGTVHFRIEAHPRAGYLLWGPTYGAHLLSDDGLGLVCAPGASGEQAWQRLLVAQVLPFSAVLGGLEAFHASAVVIGGQAIAFAGPSRAGKTSLAVELCRLGASFLADDVLVLERQRTGLMGHPGNPVAGLDHAQAERLSKHAWRGQTLAVNARERLVLMHGSAEPAPLAALFFIDRRSDGPSRPRFTASVDAQMLLAATFNFVLATPRRLQGLLDVCALVAQRRVERIQVGPSVEVSQLAEAVTRRLGASR